MTFRELLKNKKITQQRLASKIGKSQRLISSWCIGSCEPRINDLLKLHKILQVDLDVLLNSFIK